MSKSIFLTALLCVALVGVTPVASIGFSVSNSDADFENLSALEYPNASSMVQEQWTLQVLNVSQLSYSQRLCALTLQGIVNGEESSTKIFLVSKNYAPSEEFRSYDNQWLTYYVNELNFSVEYYPDLMSLIRASKSSIRGYVVYDPSVPGSQFNAATISGLNGSITVSPDMIDMVRNEGIVQDLDLRGKFVPGNTTAVYEWGFKNLYPFCNRTVIGNMIYNNADDGYYNIYMQIIDYLVSNKAFIMGLSSYTEPDRNLKQMFLDGMEKFGKIFGWHGPDDYEWVHVAQASESGQTVVCSFPESPNFSLHSRFSSHAYQQKTRVGSPVYSKSKTYVTFILSDGDALWAASSRYRNNWESPLRGKMKIGWELGPALKDLSPAILDYFYKTESSLDEFIGSASGVGYFFPDMMSLDQLRERLVMANEVMNDMDLNGLFTITHGTTPKAVKEMYNQIMPGKAFFEGYEYKQEAHEVLNSTVWFETKFPRMPIEWWKPWSELKSAIESLAQDEQFIVAHVQPIENVIEKIYNIAVNLGPNFEVVLPTELASLKAQSVRPASISDLRQFIVEAEANSTHFLYADPQRVNRSFSNYDVVAGSIIYNMSINAQRQGFDNDPLIVLQNSTDKGRILLRNTTVAMFGGPSPNLAVKYLEMKRLAPVYFSAELVSGVTRWKFVETSTERVLVDSLAATIDLEHEDYFVIMTFKDENDNRVFVNYGFDWKGTWAAGIYLESIYSDIQAYTNPYYILHWIDENKDGIPQSIEITPKTYGGKGSDEGHSIIPTRDGGFAIAGSTMSFGAGGSDVYLIKTDPYGYVQWNKTYGGANSDIGYSLVQTLDGGYAIAGYTNSFGAGGYDVFLIKTDVNGTVQWSSTYGGSVDDWGYSMVQTTDGGYAIAGYTTSFAGGGDVYLVKTDPAGNMQWNKTYGGTSYDWAYSIYHTYDAEFIIVGLTTSYGIGGDVYVIRSDSSGNMLWNKTFGNTGVDWGYDVVQTNDGGYSVVGITSSSGSNGVDVFLTKLDSNGNQQWQRTYGGTGSDEGRSIIQTNNEGYIIAGFTTSFDVDGGDVYMIKTDSLGNIELNKTYGGLGYEYGYSLAQTRDGNYIAVVGLTTSYGIGSEDVYFVRVES